MSTLSDLVQAQGRSSEADIEWLHLLVGAGPLYRGRPLFGPRIAWQTQTGTAELLGGCDLAVCAAGYNSYNELMLAGVPTIFLPQEKVADEQDRRAESAERAGAAICLRAAATSRCASVAASTGPPNPSTPTANAAPMKARRVGWNKGDGCSKFVSPK